MKFPQVRSMRAVVFAVALAVILPSEVFAQKVLLLAADENGARGTCRQRLMDTSLFTQVDLIRVDQPGPTVSLTTLLQYDSVMTWSNAALQPRPIELGDVLWRTTSMPATASCRRRSRSSATRRSTWAAAGARCRTTRSRRRGMVGLTGCLDGRAAAGACRFSTASTV